MRETGISNIERVNARFKRIGTSGRGINWEKEEARDVHGEARK